MSSLKDKVAICTGSGRKDGLGAAILRRFAADGCKLVVTDLGEFIADKGMIFIANRSVDW